MSNKRIRRRLAQEAARLIFIREETQYGRAKRKAARLLTAVPLEPIQLPCNREIRGRLRMLEQANAETREKMLLHPLTACPPDCIRSASDRFRRYELLLMPLEHVVEPLEEHPEGDVLYHSLQVFELSRRSLPYDEEFLLAALLHDVGKAIDRRDHIAAGLAALGETISPRTAWFIEHHVEAAALRNGTLGVRVRRRLETEADFEELMLLADCDRRGRMVGMPVPDVPEALLYIRQLAEACEEGGR